MLPSSPSLSPSLSEPNLMTFFIFVAGFASGITNFPVLRQGFGEEVSVATAWSHFLAEDLFIVSLISTESTYTI